MFPFATQCLDDVDCSPIESTKDLLTAEIPLLYEREEVHDGVNCDAFPPKTTFQDLEMFSSSSPAINLNDTSPWQDECFDKVRLSECSDNLINEQPAPMTERAPSPINNVYLALENTVDTDVTANVKNCHLQATCEETPSEGPSNQEGVEMQTNFPGQGKDDIITAALPDNPHKVFNVTSQDDTGSLMDSDDDDNKENKREFNNRHQENKNLEESSGQLLHSPLCFITYSSLNSRKSFINCPVAFQALVLIREHYLDSSVLTTKFKCPEKGNSISIPSGIV